MTSRICELDSSVFCGEEIGDDGGNGDSDELDRCLFSVRLLAKFLGFVHFLPYQSSEPLPSAVVTEQVDIRNRVSVCCFISFTCLLYICYFISL